MHPGHRLDLRPADVGHALVALGAAGSRDRCEQALLAVVCAEADALATLSVRAAWDLLLSSSGWPPGAEVLVSAVTHPAMATLVASAGFVPVPVQIDLGTLVPSTAALAAAVTPRTRAVLVAQLFGGRGDLAALAGFCRERGFLLVEDAAQAWTGPATLRSAADVTLVSFGLIKTATAAGGALVRVADPVLLDRLRRRQATWPVQTRAAYARRLLRALALLLLCRPRLYTLLLSGCRLARADPARLLDRVTRSASGAAVRGRRQQPSAALLVTMAWRLRADDPSAARVRARAAAGESLRADLPGRWAPPGDRAARTHWLFPVHAADPAGLVVRLRHAGVDASAGTSNLVALTDAGPATDLMRHVVYVPTYPELPSAVRTAVRRVLVEEEAGPGPKAPELVEGPVTERPLSLSGPVTERPLSLSKGLGEVGFSQPTGANPFRALRQAQGAFALGQVQGAGLICAGEIDGAVPV